MLLEWNEHSTGRIDTGSQGLTYSSEDSGSTGDSRDSDD